VSFVRNNLPALDHALFRSVMGRFASGVTVITVSTGDAMRGMTANAFMSGSLEPPLCVVAVDKEARMHRALISAERFAVNMLAEGQESLSRHFSGRPVAGISIKLEEIGGVPVLAEATARIVAQLVAAHSCGDHTLFIGEILHMDEENRPPLLYYKGRYAKLARAPAEKKIKFSEFS
jgi:flavin reductase (DIM6/NTAB) family NADH-FMN oxidoreductase RutF